MLPKVTADQHEHRAEFSIAPSMRMAVTIPIHVNEKDSGVVVYVAVGAFAPRIPRDLPNAAVVARVAAAIREALK